MKIKTTYSVKDYEKLWKDGVLQNEIKMTITYRKE